MNGIFKALAFVAAGVGLVMFASKQLMQDLSVKVSGYGLPMLSGSTLTVPVKLLFENRTPVTIEVDNLHIEFFIWLPSKGIWQKVGVVDQGLTISPGSNETVVNPTIDFKSIFSSDVLSNLTNFLRSRAVELRTDVSITKKGITFPAQSFTKTLPIV